MVTLTLFVTEAWSIDAKPSPSYGGRYTVDWNAPTGCSYDLRVYVVECRYLEEKAAGPREWRGVPVPDRSTSWTASGKVLGIYQYRVMYSYASFLTGESYSVVVDGPVSVAVVYADGAMFRQDFEALSIGSNWYGDRKLRVQSDQSGGDNGNILRATYVPTEAGSARIQKRFVFGAPRVGWESATLSFDMALDGAFEFVRDGKLNGLAGGSGTTGCKPIDPGGWSVRMTWNSRGRPNLYIYHQDRVNPCGDTFPATDFRFERNRWYRVEIFVQMNSGVGTADGRTALYVDGRPLVDVTNLNFSGDDDVKIDQFLFSTFYGGNDPSYSPSTETYIYFDNFAVYPGERIGDNTDPAREASEEADDGIASCPGTNACTEIRPAIRPGIRFGARPTEIGKAGEWRYRQTR